MTDDHKYSSLYSAIQSLDRRAKRSSEASPSSREDSPARREGSPAHRERSPPRRESYPDDPPPRTSASTRTLPAGSRGRSVLKIPHFYENEDVSFASPASPADSRAASVVKIPQIVENEDAVPPPPRTSSRHVPASSFFALNPNRSSRAPTLKLDDAVRSSASPVVPRSSSSKLFTDSNRSSQASMALPQVAENEEYNQPQEVLPHASRASSRKARFSVPPAGTQRGSRTTGRQSQFVTPGEAEESPSAVQDGQGGRASQFMTPDDSEEPQEVLSRTSMQQARVSVPPVVETTRSSTARGMYDGQGGNASQFMIPDEANEPEEALMQPSTHQVRFSVPPSVETTRGSRAGGVYDGQGGRASQFKIPNEAKPREVLTMPSTPQGSFSVPPSTETTRGSRESEVSDGQGGRASQFMTPDEVEEHQEALTRPSTQQARFSVSPTRGSRAGGVYDGQGGRASQFMIPDEAEERQEALTRPSTQARFSLSPTRGSRAGGVYDGGGGRASQFKIPDKAEERQEVLTRLSTQQARFSVSPTRGSRAGVFYDGQGGRASQFMVPDEAEERQEMLTRPSTQQARFSVSPTRGSRAGGVYDGQGGRFTIPDEAEKHQEAPTRPSTQAARFSVSPTRRSRAGGVYDGQGGRASQFTIPDEAEEHQEALTRPPQEALMRSSAQQGTGSISSLIDANRGSRMSGVSNGQGGGESQLMRLGEGEEPGEALLRTSTEKARFSIFPWLLANKSSRASEFYNGDNGRESQFMTPDEATVPSRMSSAMPGLRSSWKESPVAVPDAESLESPLKVSFAIPANKKSKNTSTISDGNQEPFMSQGDSVASPRFSSQAARASSPVVDRTDSFLRVPSVLKPEDEAYPSEVQAIKGMNRSLSPRVSAQRSRMPSSSLSQSPRVFDAFEQNRESQMIDSGDMPSNRVSSLSPSGSQMEAEWSPRSRSLLKIPSVMDNEPEMSPRTSLSTSFGDASRGSRAGSSFANSEMFEPEADSKELLAANMSGSLEAERQSMQGDQMLFPRNTRPALEGVNVQSLRATRQVPRFSSPGSEQSSRTGSPSRKFSKFSMSSSVHPSIGGEGEVNRGSRISSMPSDSVWASLPGSFQPSIESEGETPFHTSLRRPTAGSFLIEEPMSLPMTGYQDSPVYFEPQPHEFLPEGFYVENSMSPLGEEATRSRGGSFLPEVPRDAMAAVDDPHVHFNDLEQSENIDESQMRGSARPSHMFEQFPDQAPRFSSTAPSFDLNRSSRTKSYIGQGFRESQVLNGEDSMSPRASNELLRFSSFMPGTSSSNRSSKSSSLVLPQDFESKSPALDSARSSQAGALPGHQQHMPSYSMVPQDAEPQVVAMTEQGEDSMSPQASNQLLRLNSFMPGAPSNRGSKTSSLVLPQDLERQSSALDSTRSSQARALPALQQYMPSYSMAPQDAEPEVVAMTQQGEDSMSPRESNQLSRSSSFMPGVPSDQGLKNSSLVLPQDFERKSSALDSARSSQAGALPVHQQYMPSYSMAPQDAEPQVVAMTQQGEDDGATRYDGMASLLISRQPSRFSSVAASGSNLHQDPYNQVQHDFDSMSTDAGIPSRSSTEILRTPSSVFESTDVNGSLRRGSSFVQAKVVGEPEGLAFSSGNLPSSPSDRAARSSSLINSQMMANVPDASGTQPARDVMGPLLATDPNSIEASPIPNQYIQRPSSLSFSRQIQKRSSLVGAALTPRGSGENTFYETGNSTSDSSSEELAAQDKRLSLESVSRPSFSAKLSEQQSMIRPWDTERLMDTERRMTQAAFDASEGSPNDSFGDSNYTTLTRPESSEASSAHLRIFTENDPRTFEGGPDQWPSESMYGAQPFGNDQQGEERSRDSLLSQDAYESTDIHPPNALQDPEKLRSFSTKSGRKSLVQEFIYPSSSPRQSFRQSISPRADQRESLRQEASSPRHSFRESISPRADQRKSLSQEASYQSTSPRLSVRQSFGASKKDLTELQTQEFMYSPSLARTTLEQSLDQGQDQALQSMAPEMDEEELQNQELMYSPPSARQMSEQILQEEDVGGEMQYEDPTYLRDSFQQTIEEGGYETETHPSLQQQSSTISSGACNEDELKDEECFDDALAEKQHDDSEDLLLEDTDDIIEDQLSPTPNDDLHSESFTNLEESLGSFKRAFGSSASFIKVPFGASELSYEGFAKAQFVEPTAGIWPVVWRSVAMEDLIRFSKDPLTQPLLQRLAAAPHKQCAVTSFTHLLAYMGDVPTDQDLVYHMQQILMLGIKFNDFRDEIFCQICKQTTANPSRWSNGRGWQAMALCVGTFAPSSTFRPFLEAHLQQVAGHFVGQWAGDTLSYQDEGMSNPSKAAEYCLTRFQKLLQAGSRRLPPLHAEINAVEKMESIRVNIYLPDDTFKVLDLDPMATAEEVTTQLAQMNGLSDSKYYGIFQVLYGGCERCCIWSLSC